MALSVRRTRLQLTEIVCVLAVVATISLPVEGGTEPAEPLLASTMLAWVDLPVPAAPVLDLDTAGAGQMIVDVPPQVEPAPESQVEPTPTGSDPCAEALQWVGAAGLQLPTGVGYHCPSTQFAHHGAACWFVDGHCPGQAYIAVNMDLLAGMALEYLRHVVAHEICHILDFQATGRTTEAGADGCAGAHGAPA